MKLLSANLAISAALFLVARSVSTRLQSRLKQGIGIAITLLSLPSVLYALYYFHLFDNWSWFYGFRSYELANFYPATLGLFIGWLLPSISNRFARLLLVCTASVLVVVPFLKPLLVPLNASEFQERWRAGVSLQSTPSTCGPASVATILANGFHDTVSERTVAEASYSTGTGTEIWYLGQFLRARGYCVSFHARSKTIMPYAVAGTRSGGVGHFVAVLDCSNNGCRVADPLVGFVQDSEGVAFTGFYMQISKAES